MPDLWNGTNFVHLLEKMGEYVKIQQVKREVGDLRVNMVCTAWARGQKDSREVTGMLRLCSLPD